MNHFTIAALCVVIVPFSLYAAEPSAFGAGNLDTPNPYGLTSSEKVILENKNTLNNVKIKSNNQANEVDSLRERLDGLQSIIESLSRKAHNNKITITQLNEQSSQDNESTDEYEKRLSEVSQFNTQSIEKINLILPELSKIVDSINSTYITKTEFNSLVKDVNKFRSLMASELKGNTKSSSNSTSLAKMTNSDVATKAKAFYNKKYYTDAIKYYTHLIEKNYKPAYAHYMIGEMNFKRKNYSNAITYFKKSATLYSKASYMPKLMLHTGISMKHSSDNKNAQAFFKGVISKYPDSKEAVEAQKYID